MSKLVKSVTTAGCLLFIASVICAMLWIIPRIYVQGGDAMMPSIKPGRYLLLELKSYSEKPPERFDVVVCRLPSNPTVRTALRVVGLGGETIQLYGDRLLINSNTFCLSPYLGKTVITDLDPWVTVGVNQPVYVPTGSVFVLGDNAANAKDSRFFGPLPLSLVLGRVRP
jgi:signal peptidase I